MKNKLVSFILLTFLVSACTSPPPEGEMAGARGATTPGAPSTASWTAAVSPTISVSETATPIGMPAGDPTQVPTEMANERTSPVDGMPQVYVPAGWTRMGGLDIHADDRDEVPAHDVWLEAFWMDKLEVTNAMYMLCVQAGVCTPPLDWASDRRPSYFNNAEFKDYPVVHVTWEQAGTYCAWAGGRLPTEAEWERAARGDDVRSFPWGGEPPSEVYANFDRLVNDTSRVGSYPSGASPFGLLDMAGNVWEWVADLYGIEYYKISPEKNPPGPETNTTYLRVIRGGSFQDEWVDLRVSKRGAALGPNPDALYNDPNREGEHSSKIGFRCAVSE